MDPDDYFVDPFEETLSKINGWTTSSQMNTCWNRQKGKIIGNKALPSSQLEDDVPDPYILQNDEAADELCVKTPSVPDVNAHRDLMDWEEFCMEPPMQVEAPKDEPAHQSRIRTSSSLQVNPYWARMALGEYCLDPARPVKAPKDASSFPEIPSSDPQRATRVPMSFEFVQDDAFLAREESVSPSSTIEAFSTFPPFGFESGEPRYAPQVEATQKQSRTLNDAYTPPEEPLSHTDVNEINLPLVNLPLGFELGAIYAPKIEVQPMENCGGYRPREEPIKHTHGYEIVENQPVENYRAHRPQEEPLSHTDIDGIAYHLGLDFLVTSFAPKVQVPPTLRAGTNHAQRKPYDRPEPKVAAKNTPKKRHARWPLRKDFHNQDDFVAAIKQVEKFVTVFHGRPRDRSRGTPTTQSMVYFKIRNYRLEHGVFFKDDGQSCSEEDWNANYGGIRDVQNEW